MTTRASGSLTERASVPPPTSQGTVPEIGRVTFYGFCVATIGGPLALAAVYFPNILADSSLPAWLVVLAAAAAFGAPIAIWVRYSERICSPGGLYSFTRAAAGPAMGILQAGVWTVSYFLYLPYTITYVVYDLLPEVFHLPGPTRPILEVVLPIAFVLVALAGRSLIQGIALAGALQVVVMFMLFGIELGQGSTTLSGSAEASALVVPALTGSLLYVCASLPVFLGGEVEGGAETVRRGILGAYALVSILLVMGAVALSGVSGGLRVGEVPGQQIADAFSGSAFGTVVGTAAIVSIVALIGAEYIALSRLGHALIGVSRRTAIAIIAVPFVVADVVSLIDPEAFYETLIRPSLIALFVAQFIVVFVYPLYRKKNGELVLSDVILWAAASSLMGYGLWLAIAHPPAS